MNAKMMLSNAGTWLKWHKGELLSAASLICGAGAVICAVTEAPNAKSHWDESKKQLGIYKDKKLMDESYSEQDYKQDLRKTTVSMVATGAKDMKKTLILEGASIIFGIAGAAVSHKAVCAATATATALASQLAFTEDAIEDIWGPEGLLKVREKRIVGLDKKVKAVDPETGKVEEKTVHITPPDMTILDRKCAALVKTLPIEAQAAFDLSRCVLIDEDNHWYKSCNGNIDMMIPALRNAYNNMNHFMWSDKGHGRIRLGQMIDFLDFEDCSESYEGSQRFNHNLMETCGIIDQPYAYDTISHKKIRVKGFDENGFATERYGEWTHKTVSFGEEQDKYFFSYPESVDKAYFIVDGKIILSLSYDGYIANLLTDDLTPERRRSAWLEDPSMEK